jgi:hypothetical protein
MRLGHREERSESIQVKRLTPIHAFGVRLSDAIVPSGMRFLVGVLDSDKCRDQTTPETTASVDSRRRSSVSNAQIAVVRRRRDKLVKIDPELPFKIDPTKGR